MSLPYLPTSARQLNYNDKPHSSRLRYNIVKKKSPNMDELTLTFQSATFFNHSPKLSTYVGTNTFNFLGIFLFFLFLPLTPGMILGAPAKPSPPYDSHLDSFSCSPFSTNRITQLLPHHHPFSPLISALMSR